MSRPRRQPHGPSQPPLVRQGRPALVRPPLPRQAGGVQPRRHRRQAGHRHPEHVERRQPVPHALPRARRGGQARHLAGGRVPDGNPGHDARRDVHEAEHDALSQPARDGGRGSAALVSRRRRRPDGRLRQDRPGAGDGRDERQPAGASFVPAGPMLRGNWRGQILGSGSDVWKYWTERRAGTLDECSWREMEDGIARSYGTCMTMGTASTMAAAVDALGLTLPGASSIPAADSAHPRMATASRPPHRRDGVGGPAGRATS